MRRAAKRRLLITIVLVTFAVAIRFTAPPLLRHPLAAVQLIVSDPSPQLPIPVEGVHPRDLRDTWNGPRSGGRRHRGIDIFARRGTPIRSTTRGIVATVGTNRLGGRIVRILGPAGEWHYYAHLERYAGLREGELISAGAVVGYVGDSGNARGTPPHLHYGIYRFHGGAMNPYPRLIPQMARKGGFV
jgi:murein DD-endopeptidase MepM/ murein hydrolase activator NlpD